MTNGYQIVLRVEMTPVRDCERLVGDGVVNGAPHVDDADASLQEAFRFLTEVVVDPCDRRIESLINMHALL